MKQLTKEEITNPDFKPHGQIFNAIFYDNFSCNKYKLILIDSIKHGYISCEEYGFILSIREVNVYYIEDNCHVLHIKCNTEDPGHVLSIFIKTDLSMKDLITFNDDLISHFAHFDKGMDGLRANDKIELSGIFHMPNNTDYF